jgi:hypothetical protein
MAKQSKFAFLLPILLVCAAILAAFSFLPKSDQAAPPDGSISLSIDGRPLVAGNTATLRAVSSCGEFKVSLDGAEFGTGSPLLSAPFALEAGSHSFFARGRDCDSTLVFNVLARECAGNETMGCEKNGCAGVSKCVGGVFSECLLPKKVCSPGERMGCSTNGCSFGHMTCNPCGTGFSVCAADSKNENTACAGKPSCN